MPHWKLTLSYDGTAFHGWQVQPGLATVQGTLAHAIFHLSGETVLPQGSGRTDAGVHALGQVASVTIEAAIPEANLLRALNRIIPPSIRILSAEIVPATFHARHSAIRKTYEYRIFERRAHPSDPLVSDRICSPFLAPYAWDCRWPLDPDALQQAAAALVGTHDFTSFAASDPDLTLRSACGPLALCPGPSAVKTIYTSCFTREDGLVVYRISGSGFLHHMVRNIVGTLVEIGRGSWVPGDVSRILRLRDRATAGPTAPACGLFLTRVEYPAEPAALGGEGDRA